ncbi:hypothetical protein GCM10009668_13590 [Nocardioides dubius]|uniref:Uncharacterized protein n=1 Tax=Nocardioides dubius TaxID=317019 RepID=A0ABN1TQ72_9ACTN
MGTHASLGLTAGTKDPEAGGRSAQKMSRSHPHDPMAPTAHPRWSRNRLDHLGAPVPKAGYVESGDQRKLGKDLLLTILTMGSQTGSPRSSPCSRACRGRHAILSALTCRCLLAWGWLDGLGTTVEYIETKEYLAT